MLNHTKNTPPKGNQNTPIPVFRADVQAVQTGEIITLDIEFYRASKTRVVMTWEQAKALTEQLKDATAAAAACRLAREVKP